MNCRDRQAWDVTKDAVRQLLLEEGTVGDPFWVVAEIRDGRATGTLFGPPYDEKQLVALFQSHQDANAVAKQLPTTAGTWAARGLTRPHCASYWQAYVQRSRPGWSWKVDHASGRFASVL